MSSAVDCVPVTVLSAVTKQQTGSSLAEDRPILARSRFECALHPGGEGTAEPMDWSTFQ